MSRINEAKQRANNARKAAAAANKRALEVASAIEDIQIPNLDRLLGNAEADEFFGEGKTLEDKTDYIKEITGDLEQKLVDLQDRYNDKVNELDDSWVRNLIYI